MSSTQKACRWNCPQCSRELACYDHSRGLARKQATAIARIGVDEKGFRKGHRYLTIVNDVDRGAVEFVVEGRAKASWAAFYEPRTPEQLAGIEAVAMDMCGPYIRSTLEAVPLASSKIAFGRFHVMQHMTEAVDVVRCRENRLLIAEDDDRLEGTKYLWISSKENVHPKRRAESRLLRGSDLKTARAWAIKENLRHMWSSRVAGWARRFSSQWSGWAMRSRLEPIKCSGPHDRPSPRQHHRPLRPSTDQRGRRGPQKQVHGYQASGRGLPERRELQGRDLLLLRWLTALTMKMPNGPSFRPRKARMG